MPFKSMDDTIIVKIIILGAANSGKTSIIQRYFKSTFSADRVVTIGADFYSKKMTVANLDIVLQAWDTAGQERYASGTIASPFYKKADGILLVYDVTTLTTAQQLTMFSSEVMNAIGSVPPLIVIGNKIDLMGGEGQQEARSEAISAAKLYCETGKMPYVHLLTSAKDGHGIEAALSAIVARAVDNRKTKDYQSGVRGTGAGNGVISLGRGGDEFSADTPIDEMFVKAGHRRSICC